MASKFGRTYAVARIAHASSICVALLAGGCFAASDPRPAPIDDEPGEDPTDPIEEEMEEPLGELLPVPVCDPSRGTPATPLRRLTKNELSNSLFDLLGAAIHDALAPQLSQLPDDDLSAG